MVEFIKNMYKKYEEVINYLFFGVLTTIVSIISKYILLFIIFDATIAIELQFSIIISWIIAVLFAYFTNKIFVFKSTSQNDFKEFISFVLARLSTLFLEMIIMWFFVTFLKLNSDLYVVIFTIISQVIVVISNYILSKIFVFKKVDK